MKKPDVTFPQFMFIIGTRAALAAGVALLVSNRLKTSTRRTAGLALAGLGGLSTIPAAKMAFGRKPLLARLGLT